MTRTIRTVLGVLVAALFLYPAALRADITVPYLTGRVVDDAHILSDAARERITALAKAHETATTNQVVVLTVPSIGDASIEEYAVKVFEAWKLGQKGKDNGVLVVVAPQDHKMRIEVGYGLESTLPDGATGAIIRTWMTPAFKAGNYDKGIEDGVAAIIARLEGQNGPTDRTPAVAPGMSSSGGPALPPMPVRIVGMAFLVLVLGIFTVVGVMVPGFGWFLYVFLIPFWGLFPQAFIGWAAGKVLFLAYLVGFPIAKLTLKRSDWYKKASTDMKGGSSSWASALASSSSSSSGWSSSSSSSSWSSSSSDSFSGGGGSSGGGGASGSW